MIKLTKIAKYFATDSVKTTALASIDLAVKAGEFVAVVGPSGSGKSTLLNIFGFIDTPNDGEYIFDGKPTAKLKEHERLAFRREVGFIFQKFNLIESLSIRENIRVPLLCHGLPRAEEDKRIDAMMDRVGIKHRAGHKPHQLSGGQQQRAAIARALVANPKLILADEPTGNLDSQHGDEIFKMLQELHSEGATIIMVTHDTDLANAAQRQIRIKDGKIVGLKAKRAA
jgi:putative ABC transport system ATP-binding protein